MVFSIVLQVIHFFFPWALAGLYLLAQHPPRGKLTFLVTFLHPDSQPPLDTTSTVCRLASNTWKSRYFSVSKSSQGPETVALFYLVKPVGVKQTQLCGSFVLQSNASFYKKKTLARPWGFTYTSFLKAFNTYIKYTDDSSVPLLLWGLKSSNFFLTYLFHALHLNLWPYVVYPVSHQNLVNYTIFLWIIQYSSHRVLAKTGFDKVGHRWA